MEAGIPLDEQFGLLNESTSSGFLPPQVEAQSYTHLGYLYRATDLNKAHQCFVRSMEIAQHQKDALSTIRAMDAIAFNCILQGEWDEAIKYLNGGIKLSKGATNFGLSSLLKHRGWAFANKGHLNSALDSIQQGLNLYRNHQDDGEVIRLTRRLAEIQDKQGRWAISNSLLQSLIRKDEELGRIESKANDVGLLGISYLKQGKYEDAKSCLLQAIPSAHLDFKPIAFNALGEVQFRLENLDEARVCFESVMRLSRGNHHHIAKSSLGLLEVNLLRANLDDAKSDAVQIEFISKEHDYNDHLALLLRIQAHIAWDGKYMNGVVGLIPRSTSTNTPLSMPCAITAFCWTRYFRGVYKGHPYAPSFRTAWNAARKGGGCSSPCATGGERRSYNIGTPVLDTISTLFPEGIPLIEAERIAREREPGDSSPQKSVVEQIEQALAR